MILYYVYTEHIQEQKILILTNLDLSYFVILQFLTNGCIWVHDLVLNHL